MGWMTEQLWFNPQKWWQNFLFYKIAQNRSDTHLSSNSMDSGGRGTPSSMSQQSGHEANHSSPPSTKVENEWGDISIPAYVCMARTWISWPLPSPLAPTTYVGIRKVTPPQNYLAQDVWSWSGTWASFCRGVRIGKHSGLRCIRFNLVHEFLTREK